MKRWDIINVLINRYACESYLEIGVHNRECFDKVQCQYKRCVDPKFPADYYMTSDKFFAINERVFDCVFVDGLHTDEQVYRDIEGAVRMGARVIVVHDVNPETEWHTRPVKEYNRGEEWNGTTYRGFIRYKKKHPEHEIYTVDADYGCGVIIPGKDEITWETFDTNRKNLLSLLSVGDFHGV